MHRIILDVDTGTDDAVALMVAALSPDIDLVGATVVNGNVPVEIGYENTLRVLDYIECDVPVHAGMQSPIVRSDFPEPRDVSGYHGRFLDLPAARERTASDHAVDWLVDTYLAAGDDITLVPVGPLSNIAMALKKEPRLISHIPEIVLMGGGHEIGNMSPSAEFNIWADPEAAHVVFSSGIPIRMIGLDATHRALVSRQDCERLAALNTPAAIAASRFIDQRIDGYNKYQPMSRPDTAPVHDALAVCSVLEPSILETVFVNVVVDTADGVNVGRTVCDVYHRSGRSPNVHVALNADEPRFLKLLFDILGRNTV